MKLYEFEGKLLLKEAGIEIPQSTHVTSSDSSLSSFDSGSVIKAQTLRGSRKKRGLIFFNDSQEAVNDSVHQLLGKTIDSETITSVLIEEKIPFVHEHYLGIIFCQEHRGPVLIISTKGGIDIEEIEKNHPDEIKKIPIDIRKGISRNQAQDYARNAGFCEEECESIAEVIDNLYTSFVEHDMKMVEINPLVRTTQGSLVALDAVVVLDDSAQFRKTHAFPKRLGIGRLLTADEEAAHKIDEEDHRGVAGKTYVDLDGDIGILASGGGMSMTAVDALLSYGITPANYTEFSGNAPAQKVERLARIVMSQPNLKALWIVGGTANFTQIDVTMGAILTVIIEKKPTYPIIVRRGGPGEDKAFEMLEHAKKTYNLEIHCFRDTVPMTQTAHFLAQKMEEEK